MRKLLVIGIVLAALLVLGCTGTPQQPAPGAQAAQPNQTQQAAQPSQGNPGAGANSAAQDDKYLGECMSASVQASRDGDYQAGIARCTASINAISSEKAKALPYRFRASLKENAGDLEGADADFTLSIKADPSDYVGYENRGCFRYRMNRTAEAKEDVDAAHGLYPRIPSSDAYDFEYICVRFHKK